MFVFYKIKNILFGNNQINLKNEKCVKCNGSGLMLLDKPIICKNCNGKICYMCEIKGPVRIFDECNLCFGKGYN